MSRFEAGATAGDVQGNLWGVVVTYERPVELAFTLKSLAEQTRPIDRLVVVDNGSSLETSTAAEAAGAMYLDAKDNLGPAGGIALGMRYVLDHAEPADWLILIDDDDPPRDTAMVERLIAFGHSMAAMDTRLAGVGQVGARYEACLGVARRLGNDELQGPVRVDYIGGGQFPTLRCRVLREVGVWDATLFFGFDDLEYGLRLGAAGYALYVDGDVWKASRARSGKLDHLTKKLKTAPNTAAWRRYYGPRNATLIAKRYGHAWTPFIVAAAAGFKGALALARDRRPMREIRLPILGAVHGLLGRSGRIVEPGRAEKVS